MAQNDSFFETFTKISLACYFNLTKNKILQKLGKFILKNVDNPDNPQIRMIHLREIAGELSTNMYILTIISNLNCFRRFRFVNDFSLIKYAG